MRGGERKWLGLSVLGLAPLVFVGVFLAQEGFDLGAVGDQLEEPLTLAILADVMVSSIVFWVWMWPRARAEARKSPWLFVAANLLVGLSFALPLFLYFRARDTG
jgi:hypothetical protein